MKSESCYKYNLFKNWKYSI